MSKDTSIEWCDSSANPVMGCDGCELWIPGKVEHCYAGSLHKIRAGRPGYADKFEVPKLFPGRMAIAANWNTTPNRTDKPWLTGPRKIFISDMGDALSRDVPLEYLRDEVIGAVNSEKGRRHQWLWLTKQPARMVKLAEMIGIWPENLWAMTSVTSGEQLGRVRQLLRVPAKVRGVSYEPALGPVDFGHFLTHGLHWHIVGGESGPSARPFDLAWARSAVQQCKDAGVAVFVKQLGSVPIPQHQAGAWDMDHPNKIKRVGPTGTCVLDLRDRKGGDMSEWPEDLRVREFPR